MAKSKIINGYSYEFNSDGQIIGVFNHSANPINPPAIDPNSQLFANIVSSRDALTASNFNKYGGDKDAYERSIALAPEEQLNDFYTKESKDNKDNLKETEYPNIDNNASNPNLVPKPPATSAYAAYKRDRKTGGTDLFTYPIDIDPQQDHLKISKYSYKRNEDTGQAVVQGSRPPHVEKIKLPNTFGEKLYNVGKSKEDQIQPVELQRQVKGDSMIGNDFLGSVMLPMPKVVDTNGCEWGESELNIFGLTAVQAAEQGRNVVTRGKFASATKGLKGTGAEEEDRRAVEAITARAQRGGKLFKRFQGLTSAIANAAQAEAAARITGQSVSQDQFLARTSGRVLNPNAELLFQGPVLRDFNFDFLLIARSEKEGKEIRKIIRWFKSGMAPKFNSATFLKTPDIFTLEYKNGTRSSDILKTVNRFSPGGLALRTIAVDYAPSGYWSAYQDSQPVSIKMSLNFAELRPIYSQDQNQDELTDSVGY